MTKNVAEHFGVFGASGALLFALLTWIVLTFVFRPGVGREAQLSVRADVLSTPLIATPPRAHARKVERAG